MFGEAETGESVRRLVGQPTRIISNSLKQNLSPSQGCTSSKQRFFVPNKAKNKLSYNEHTLGLMIQDQQNVLNAE